MRAMGQDRLLDPAKDRPFWLMHEQQRRFGTFRYFATILMSPSVIQTLTLVCLAVWSVWSVWSVSVRSSKTYGCRQVDAQGRGGRL